CGMEVSNNLLVDDCSETMWDNMSLRDTWRRFRARMGLPGEAFREVLVETV
ncbi:hypothetical protein V5O48_012681, partial [Marasmius crinis-equi]